MTQLSARRTGPQTELPLVLLHAMPLTSRMWEPVVKLLPDIDVICVDAPGCGESPAGAALDSEYGHSEPAMDSYLQALEETLAGYGLAGKRFVIAGISMGGAVAAAYSLRHAQEVAGLAIIDSGIGAEPAESPRLGTIEKIAHEGSYAVLQAWTNTMLSRASSEQLHAEFDAYFKTVPAEMFIWLQRMMVGRPDSQAALDLDIPIMLIRGEDDPNTSTAQYERMQERAKRARFVEIADASHFSASEKPAEIADLLRELYQAATAKN
ncbi:alpha/beta fold hydrolase [Actinobaculum suis]|uniref:alpha/beta fold hydrolase n=1 Tax=Actinobaculum suis TaxID=1657 RepID=UPI00080867B6|nr:alpha/beta hydrolase [Actinobaculum suis]OCA94641.1 hypothetical protein ACU20_06800 [Actinobaculum suis]OCA94953.1 hypothetical protein ACU21_05590 [Actinobaculum suis]